MLQSYYIVCKTTAPCLPKEVECVCSHSSVWVPMIWAGILALTVIISVAIVLFYLHKRNKLKKEMAKDDHDHEQELKKMEYNQEKFWYFQKLLKHDFKKELEARVQELIKEKDELSQKLKDEKENVNATIEKERLQAEHDFYEKILSQIYSTENNQSNKQ